MFKKFILFFAAVAAIAIADDQFETEFVTETPEIITQNDFDSVEDTTSVLSPKKTVTLNCDYKFNTEWWAINYVYFCEQDADLDIKVPNTEISSVLGQHWPTTRDNQHVRGFRVDKHVMHYFPKGLENYFQNLEFIAVWSTGLKEIFATDLAPFTKLRVLSLWDNEIEYLEKDLLLHNTEIEYIGFGVNKIKFVDPNVFDSLGRLHTLHFDRNECYSKQIAGNRRLVLHMIEELVEKCYSNELD